MRCISQGRYLSGAEDTPARNAASAMITSNVPSDQVLDTGVEVRVSIGPGNGEWYSPWSPWVHSPDINVGKAAVMVYDCFKHHRMGITVVDVLPPSPRGTKDEDVGPIKCSNTVGEP